MVLFKCVKCGRSHSKPRITCSYCGGLVRPVYEWFWNPRRGVEGIWGFRSMLPRLERWVGLGEAWTPLIPSSRLFRDQMVYFKDEGRNPTGSFRDRAAALVVSHACSIGAKRIILASDGNMGVSVSAYSARCGLKTRILVPHSIDPVKVLLMKAFGSEVLMHDKGIDELIQLSRKYESRGYYNATSTLNTLSIEGLKTISYELFLDLPGIREVFIPLGSGLTVLSIYIGFKELFEHGLINRIPKLIGVETCGNPVYSSMLGTGKHCYEKPFPGLSYKKPVLSGIVSDVLSRNGGVIVVNRREAINAAKLLSRLEGLFVEPSSAVALAGALKHGINDYGVVLLTGHGLKGPWMYVRGSRLRETRIFPGTTKHLILEILAENPGLTGYEVWKKLGLKITPQAVYQHLRELEDQGYVESRLLEGKKKYYITNKARKIIG